MISAELLGAWHARIRQARPFLKWAGGKQHFLYEFAGQLPEVRGAYVEPFLGSGAVFFKLMSRQARPGAARLGDINAQLIQAFLAVKEEPEKLYQELRLLQDAYDAADNKPDFYYEKRRIFNATLPKPDPALFILLNRTCWNGLFRVNRLGHFNVPYGAPKSDVVIPSLEDLLNASAALQQAELRATSWENTLALAQKGDFVFLDPPYYSDLQAGDVQRATKYQSKPFGLDEHRHIADWLVRLELKGNIDFALTNSAEPEMTEMYRSRGLRVQVIRAPRAINSRLDRRGPVDELLVTSKRLEMAKPDQLAWMLSEH